MSTKYTAAHWGTYRIKGPADARELMPGIRIQRALEKVGWTLCKTQTPASRAPRCAMDG